MSAKSDPTLVLLAKTNPFQALSKAFMLSFGFPLSTAIAIFKKVVISGCIEETRVRAEEVMAICIASSTNIRGNVTIVGTDFGGIRDHFPELTIAGNRAGISDGFNFGALRMVGHIANLVASNDLARNANAKAGNCVSGEGLKDSVAGKINREVYASFSEEEKRDARDLKGKLTAVHLAFLESVYEKMKTSAKD